MAEGQAPLVGHIKDETRKLAIKNAQENALRQYLCNDLSFESMWINYRLSGSTVGLIPFGEITDKKILFETEEHPEKIEKNTTDSYYKVKLKAKIKSTFQYEEPHFQIDIGLNRIHFKSGDQMQIFMRTTIDAYYYLFLIMEDNQALCLVPNRYRKTNLIKAGSTAVFPDEEDIKKGIFLEIALPSHKTHATEMIYAVCLKKHIPHTYFDIPEGIYGMYDGQTASIGNVIGKIVQIPLSDRSEALVRYYIAPK